jgi:hypothetical protein
VGNGGKEQHDYKNMATTSLIELCTSYIIFIAFDQCSLKATFMPTATSKTHEKPYW